jgi:ATP-binding cassette subfamily B protein RaxB
VSAAAESVLAGLRFGGGKRLPVILQTEAAECGLACLAMVASYYGYEIDLPGMRRKASMSLKGATLKRVMDIAGKLALDTRALRLELEDLAALKTPCIRKR